MATKVEFEILGEQNVPDNDKDSISISRRIEQRAFYPPRRNNVQGVNNLIFIHHAKTQSRIPALLIEYPHAHEDTPIVLFSHGNAENLASIEPWLYTLSQVLCAHVIAYEYQGYGIGEEIDAKRASEKSMYDRISATYYWIVHCRKIKPQNIFLFGFSIGTVPTISLAAAKDIVIAGVILQGTFLSVCSLLADRFAFCLAGMVRGILENFDIMKNYERLAEFDPSIPVLIIHGEKDPEVPISHATAISEILQKCPVDLLFFEQGKHEDIHTRPGFETRYYNGIRNFLDKDKS